MGLGPPSFKLPPELPLFVPRSPMVYHRPPALQQRGFCPCPGGGEVNSEYFLLAQILGRATGRK
jgi:hypothetical protein